MNRFLRCGPGALALLLVTACGEKNEVNPGPDAKQVPAGQSAPKKAPTRGELGQELGNLMATFGKTVKSVSDRQTWEPAKVELARIEARIEAITAELRTLPSPSAGETLVAMEAMKQNEENLSKALGDKNAFMQRLPQDVSRELGQAAGAFSNKMGSAQQALYGNNGP